MKTCNHCSQEIKENFTNAEFMEMSERWFSNVPTTIIGIFPHEWKNKKGWSGITPYGKIDKIIYADVQNPIITLQIN